MCIFLYRVGISTWISDSTSRSFDSVKESEHTRHYINTCKSTGKHKHPPYQQPDFQVRALGNYRILETLCLETHCLCIYKSSSIKSFQIKSKLDLSRRKKSLCRHPMVHVQRMPACSPQAPSGTFTFNSSVHTVAAGAIFFFFF